MSQPLDSDLTPPAKPADADVLDADSEPAVPDVPGVTVRRIVCAWERTRIVYNIGAAFYGGILAIKLYPAFRYMPPWGPMTITEYLSAIAVVGLALNLIFTLLPLLELQSYARHGVRFSVGAGRALAWLWFLLNMAGMLIFSLIVSLNSH